MKCILVFKKHVKNNLLPIKKYIAFEATTVVILVHKSPIRVEHNTPKNSVQGCVIVVSSEHSNSRFFIGTLEKKENYNPTDKIFSFTITAIMIMIKFKRSRFYSSVQMTDIVGIFTIR